MVEVKRGDRLQVEGFAKGSRVKKVTRTYEVLSVSPGGQMKLRNVRGTKEFWVPGHIIEHHSDLITHIRKG